MNEKKNQILIMGHRGASKIAPENTLLAFRKAIELKADFIEFDVLRSLDKELVITHDENVSRLTGKNELVKKMTLKELKQLDFGEGEKIPTLNELIETTKGFIKLNCEIKVEGIVKKTLELFRNYDIIDSTIVSSFLHDELLKFQLEEPNLKLASLEPTAGTTKLDWNAKKKMIDYCVDNNLYAINPLVIMVDQQFVDYAHDNEIKIFPWTVDTKISIKKLIKYGVDGIITNDIETVRNILEKAKIR
ncbi:MAG: glycerophosphodiester phosphodiesterase [Promethearchaeota archaeon]